MDLVTYSILMDATCTSLSQARKVIYLTFVNSNGANGAIIENKVHNFHLIKIFLVEYSVHQEGREIRYTSVLLRPMSTLFLVDPFVP